MYFYNASGGVMPVSTGGLGEGTAVVADELPDRLSYWVLMSEELFFISILLFGICKYFWLDLLLR